MSDKSYAHYFRIQLNSDVKVFFENEVTKEEALELLKDGNYEDLEIGEYDIIKIEE